MLLSPSQGDTKSCQVLGQGEAMEATRRTYIELRDPLLLWHPFHSDSHATQTKKRQPTPIAVIMSNMDSSMKFQFNEDSDDDTPEFDIESLAPPSIRQRLLALKYWKE